MTVKYDGISVEYIDHMGTDITVVNAARVSYNRKKEELEDKDIKLLNYLAKHKHYTPFEHCCLSVMIQCPLYIRSQIMRHRAFSYNEVSRRYTSEELSFYVPQHYRAQHVKSKQCSDGLVNNEANLHAQVAFERVLEDSLRSYEEMIDNGVARELARGILPQCLNTKFYMTGDLRNWAAFLKLRLDGHAQEEVQEVAKGVCDIIEDYMPEAYKALIENS